MSKFTITLSVIGTMKFWRSAAAIMDLGDEACPATQALVDDLGDATDTISSITVSTAGDKFYAVAYDNGDAYIYFLDSAKVISDTSVTVNEVELVAFIDTVTADAFASDANTAMRDLTDLDATY